MAQEPKSVALYQCGECGNVQHSWQDRYCIACWSSHLETLLASQDARLLSWATYHTDYKLEGIRAPYTVGFIELAEGPKVPCWLSGDMASASYGQAIRVTQADDLHLANPDPGGLFAVVIPPA